MLLRNLSIFVWQLWNVCSSLKCWTAPCIITLTHSVVYGENSCGSVNLERPTIVCQICFVAGLECFAVFCNWVFLPHGVCKVSQHQTLSVCASIVSSLLTNLLSAICSGAHIGRVHCVWVCFREVVWVHFIIHSFLTYCLLCAFSSVDLQAKICTDLCTHCRDIYRLA